jgi:hemerythrin-like domain-containing protein
MKSTDLLMQDHKIILRAVDVLEDMAKRLRYDQQIDHEDLQSILRFIRLFADEYHQTKEENVLFPELRAAQPQERPLREIMFEHDDVRMLVTGLEDALETRQGLHCVYMATRLTTLIRNHIYNEDRALFSLVERSLSAEQDEKVASEISKFPVEADLMGELCRLEWKYLRRAA